MAGNMRFALVILVMLYIHIAPDVGKERKLRKKYKGATSTLF
jgi:hypothetical protein